MPRLKNSFWFNHAANKSKAKLIHADIYNLPEIGEFDVAVLASVLLHCQCPAKIISQCAKRCRSILIIGDTKVTFHEHRHTLVPERMFPMFSVVGSRT